MATIVPYTILVTDRNLNIVGDPIINWSTIDVTLKWVEPDTGLFSVPAYPWVVEQIEAGNRIVVIREGEILTAGPMEKWLFERSDNGENSGYGNVTVNFTSDLAWAAARCAYPNPAQTVAGQTVDNWTYTGNAELGIRQLVNSNAGPGALVPRRVPKLILGAEAGAGTNVAVTATRMQPLLEVARAMAETGGGLGFRTRQVGSDIVFEVFAPTDKSSAVFFGFNAGNMKYVSYEVTAPKATSIAVGGQGEGADRAMIERLNTGDEAAWGRFETLIARAGNDDLDQLQDEGDRGLVDGASTTRLATSLSDTPDQRYGTHYRLGDIVRVESWTGQSFADVIRTVHFQVYPTSGEYVSATVGSQAAATDPMWVQKQRELDARLGRLERIVVPAT